MEKRRLRIMFNKNGKGSQTNRIALPVPWIKEMGFTENESTALVEFNNNTITIKKDEDFVLLQKAEDILQKLELKSTHGDKRKSLKAQLNEILSKCYNSGIDIEYLTVKYPIIKEINVFKTSEGKGAVVVVYSTHFKFKED